MTCFVASTRKRSPCLRMVCSSVRLAGGGEVVHQRVDDVVLARLLEVGHHDVARIGLGVGARLAHQAGRPQAQHLVLAGARLELQLHVVARTCSRRPFRDRRTSSSQPLRNGVSRRVIAARRGLSTPPRRWQNSHAMPLDDMRAWIGRTQTVEDFARPLAGQGPDRHPGRARPRAAHGRSPAAALALALFPRGGARRRRSGPTAMASAATSCRRSTCRAACGPAAASASTASRCASAIPRGASRRSSRSSPRPARAASMVFVTVQHTLSGPRASSLRRGARHRLSRGGQAGRDGARAQARADRCHAPSKTIVPDPVLLFRFSALTFNGHRIHYDQPYVTGDRRLSRPDRARPADGPAADRAGAPRQSRQDAARPSSSARCRRFSPARRSRSRRGARPTARSPPGSPTPKAAWLSRGRLTFR